MSLSSGYNYNDLMGALLMQGSLKNFIKYLINKEKTNYKLKKI